MVFPVVIYGYESWMIRKAEYWRTDAFELWCWKRLMNCKEIQPVHPKGDQSWISIGGTDAEAETPILWPPDAESWLVGKDPDAGKDWKQEEKGMMEDEMFVWHHRLNGHEFEQTPGDGDEQGSLVCYRLWGSQKVGHDWVTELNCDMKGSEKSRNQRGNKMFSCSHYFPSKTQKTEKDQSGVNYMRMTTSVCWPTL